MAANEKAFIDWPEVNRRLPIAQDPKSRAERKALFKQLLPQQKKTLSLEDLQKGIKNELRYDMAATLVSGIKEMTKAIRFAFKASSELAPTKAHRAKVKKQASAKVDTGMDKTWGKTLSIHSRQSNQAPKATVDRREFHAFLVSLRYYLEVAELFENMDGAFTDDQKLSCRECLRGKETLARWGLTEEMVRERFKEVDVWTPLMTFQEFAEWVMAFRWEGITLALDDSDDEEVQYHRAKSDMIEAVDLPFSDLGTESDLNKIKIKEIFVKWDLDKSGGIEEEELAAIMNELNPCMTKDIAKRLFTVADVNKDGVIDYDELVEFLFDS